MQRRSVVEPVRCECGDHYFAKTSKWGVALVSPEDRWALTKPWAIWTVGKLAYAMRNLRGDGIKTTVRLHIEIMGRPGVDHRNSNGLDCRRHNLRFADQTFNNANKRIRKDNLTGYKGVVFHKRNSVKPWQARACFRGKSVSAGYYATKEEAAFAYDCLAIDLFGEFALLNQPFSQLSGGTANDILTSDEVAA